MKPKHCALKWGLWWKDNSNALVQQLTSKINMALALKLNTKLKSYLKKIYKI